MDITCISDLHGHYPKLDGGDLLIIAGDLTARDTINENIIFFSWLEKQNYKKKILIAGNHDNMIEDGLDLDFPEMGIEYLCDSGTEFEGLKIWGSPWTALFHGVNPYCRAFMIAENLLANKWDEIPQDTDILITHMPPHGILDMTIRNEHVGSQSLVYKIGSMVNPPKLWVWGHIHEAYGRDQPIRNKPCIMVNASHVNEHYLPINPPIRVIL